MSERPVSLIVTSNGGGSRSSLTIPRLAGSAPMKIRVIDSITEARAISDRWSELADRTGSRHYAQPFWALTWWRHLGRGNLHIVAVEEQDQLRALAPLYRQRVFGIDFIRFLGQDLGAVTEVLLAPGDVEAALALQSFLFSHRRSVLDLVGYRETSQSFLSITGSGVVTEAHDVCPMIKIAGSWTEYFNRRPPELRRKLRRADRFADQDGVRQRIEIVEDSDTLNLRLNDVTAIYDAAEHDNPRLHFLRGKYRPFMIDMLQRAAQESRLAMFVLDLGDSPAACAFALRSGSLLGYSGPRFDPRFGRFSPGHLVLRAIIEYAFLQRFDDVDLLAGDARYKREWSTSSYETRKLLAASGFLTRLCEKAVAAAPSGIVRTATTAFARRGQRGPS